MTNAATVNQTVGISISSVSISVASLDTVLRRCRG
jgi:hypothetical protein